MFGEEEELNFKPREAKGFLGEGFAGELRFSCGDEREGEGWEGDRVGDGIGSRSAIDS